MVRKTRHRCTDIVPCDTVIGFRSLPAKSMLLSSYPDGELRSAFGNLLSPFWFLGGKVACKNADETSRRKRTMSTQKPWIYSFDLNGFHFDDISVKVKSEKVLIHAKKEEDDGFLVGSHEVRKCVSVPDGVDTERMTSFLTDQGELILKAPYVEKCEKGLAKRSRKEEEKVDIKLPEAEQHSVGTKQDKVLSQTVREDGGDDRTEEYFEDYEKSDDSLCTETENSTCQGAVSDTVHIEDTRDSHERKQASEIDVDASQEAASNPIPADEDQTLMLKKTPKTPAASRLEGSTIVDKDGRQEFQVQASMKNFDPMDISVRIKDNTVFIEGKTTREENGLRLSQEIYKQYAIPGIGNHVSAKAEVNRDGFVRVFVPLNSERKSDENIIPINYTS